MKVRQLYFSELVSLPCADELMTALCLPGTQGSTV